MNTQNEPIGLMVGKDDQTTRNICQRLASDRLPANVGSEGDEPEIAGSYWSGQPGKDLFFNGWKLLF